MKERYINVGKIILKEIDDYDRKKTGRDYFPSSITSLCLRAQVKTKANLNGPYVQGCIIAHDLERLMENVHELNPIEPSEPTEPKTDKSSNKSKTEANSVTETKVVESKEEPNEPESIKEPKVSEPRGEPNVNEPVKPSINLELTIPMPTSSKHCKEIRIVNYDGYDKVYA
ncbi:hypothetical protein J1N35_004870 [Gossypium stocksii]|uniref:Uncharacterized protein n=1 Tax=Gossypium stocksii TaxID=47602 RepID=A0A9D3WEU9_9ROSI|nr:hypothetical protein J1N35_004870 [Gossypium stocksii]